MKRIFKYLLAHFAPIAIVLPGLISSGCSGGHSAPTTTAGNSTDGSTLAELYAEAGSPGAGSSGGATSAYNFNSKSNLVSFDSFDPGIEAFEQNYNLSSILPSTSDYQTAGLASQNTYRLLELQNEEAENSAQITDASLGEFGLDDSDLDATYEPSPESDSGVSYTDTDDSGDGDGDSGEESETRAKSPVHTRQVNTLARGYDTSLNLYFEATELPDGSSLIGFFADQTYSKIVGYLAIDTPHWYGSAGTYPILKKTHFQLNTSTIDLNEDILTVTNNAAGTSGTIYVAYTDGDGFVHGKEATTGPSGSVYNEWVESTSQTIHEIVSQMSNGIYEIGLTSSAGGTIAMLVAPDNSGKLVLLNSQQQTLLTVVWNAEQSGTATYANGQVVTFTNVVTFLKSVSGSQ